MELKEALEIVSVYDDYSDLSCWCHLGNPPCTKCVMCPSKEDYEEALLIIAYNGEEQ